MKTNKPKFGVGDIVKINGRNEEFVIIEWIYECSEDLDGYFFENYSYMLRGLTTGKLYDIINDDEEDLKIVRKKSESRTISEGDQVSFTSELKKPLSKEEIDFLLDQYNTFMEVHNLIIHLGVKEEKYKKFADDILEYLSKE
jgi:hypothetical protein